MYKFKPHKFLSDLTASVVKNAKVEIKTQRSLSLCLCVFVFYLFFAISCIHAEYIYNPYVPREIWEEVKPYFLPEDHPIKKKLDKIFQERRAIKSRETLEKAGFGYVRERKETNIFFSRHPRLKGYLVKTYLDTQPPIQDWRQWLKRINGANRIRACINRHQFKRFKVPHKWIYPLPAEPSPPLSPSFNRKNFVLIVEDMRPLSMDDNLKAYQKKMTPALLEALFTIITEEGLIDSIYPDNTPFNVNGDICFIDTEHSGLEPINYGKLLRFLSPAMQAHWQKLMGQVRP